MSFGFSIIFWKEKCFGKNVVYPFLLQKLWNFFVVILMSRSMA
jgi:hypothetical protein